MKHFEKIRLFWKNPVFLSFSLWHPSFNFSIRPFLCHVDLPRKKWNILRKHRVFLRQIRVFLRNIWVQPGSGRALSEKPYRSSSPFCAPQQVWKLLIFFCINFGCGFTYTAHKCHWPAKHQHSNQVQSDSLPNASGDVTSGTEKMLNKGVCKRHVVKWQAVPSRKFAYPKFSHMFQKKCRKHLLSDFWGMLKTLLI